MTSSISMDVSLLKEALRSRLRAKMGGFVGRHELYLVVERDQFVKSR